MREDEPELLRLRPSVLSYPGHLLYFALVFVIGVLLLVLLHAGRGYVVLLLLALLAGGAASLWLRRLATVYVVTTRRIIERRGVLGRQEKEVEIRDIRLLSVEQSFLERLLGIGRIEINTAAGNEVEMTFAGFADPLRVKALIAEQRPRT